MTNFAHLHVHTQYSILDGACKVDELLDTAKNLGFESIAITDHGVMYGAVEFYIEAKKRGIKPIIGCEVYTARGSRFSKNYNTDSNYGHLVLLCKNNIGYRNLMKIVSLAQTEGFYYKPRVDDELLRSCSDGLIALSGCLKGDVSMCLADGRYNDAKKTAEKYINIFGKENFYLEIQDHGISEQTIVNDGMLRLSAELGAELVATNDVHYIKKEDSVVQDILTCIQLGKRIDDTDRLRFRGSEFYLKSPDEMGRLFADIPSAVENTVKIAQRCNVELDFNSVHLPKIHTDNGIDHFEYMKSLCENGAKAKYGDDYGDDVKNRLEYELSVINKMGYTDYFLIVHDFIKYAKDNSIPIGPGRGSAAGSIVSYTLNITEIDPLKYDLLFERFLNPERVSMPDIDIDISDMRREDVKDYVVQKYGTDRVAGIVTFGTLAARAAVRDVGRVLGIAPYNIDKTSGLIPDVPHITLSDSLENEPELKKLFETVPEINRLVKAAMRVEGFIRNVSTHAAGVVISDDSLFYYTPLQGTVGNYVTQYPMSALEKLGLLKMDFLAVRNLTIIDDTLKMISASVGKKFLVNDIQLNDSKTYALISRGETDGVFQLENNGLKSFLRKLRPRRLEDIVTATSIYRPGPMEQIPEFLKAKSNPDTIKYAHPLLEPILKPTFGAIIYQEQVMNIVRVLAGYSASRADLVRRAMAKKKNDEMIRERNVFIGGMTDESGRVLIAGTRRNGIPDDTANFIFDKLLHFANYAFNKSHAVCYALVAYRTAYLKANYPAQYLAALLSNLAGNFRKTSKYINDFSRYGVKLLPPDINLSGEYYSAEKDNVRFGLSALRGVGDEAVRSICKERAANGKFTGIDDFMRRTGTCGEINRKCMESLIKAGAFDSLFPNRRMLLLSSGSIIDSTKKEINAYGSEQFSMFENDTAEEIFSLNPNDTNDFSDEEKLSFEIELAGVYLSGNPIDSYMIYSAAFADKAIFEIAEGTVDDSQTVKIFGVLSEVKKRKIKSGKLLCTMMISDLTGAMELAAFEKAYERCSGYLYNGAVVCATARVRKRDDGFDLNLINALPGDSVTVTDSMTLYIRIPSADELDTASKIIGEYCGKSKVCIYIEDTSVTYRSDNNHGVSFTNDLIKKLCKEFSAENVRLK